MGRFFFRSMDWLCLCIFIKSHTFLHSGIFSIAKNAVNIVKKFQAPAL